MPTLTYNANEKRFEFLTASPTERFPAKEAGFRYDGKRVGCWYTDQTHKAAKLIHFADGFTRTLLEEADKMAQKSLAASTATDADIEIPVNDGLAYRPFQRAGVAFANSRPSGIRGALLADEMGLGKQQPVDTNVLTPNGWQQIGCLQPGDYVIGSDGRSTMVRNVYPQGEKPSYRVTFSDGSSVEAGLEHLWTVRYRRGGRVWEELTLTTEQLLTRPMLVRTWPNGRTTKLNLKSATLYLPMLTGPVAFTEVCETMPVDPYTMGMMLGNGYLTGSSVQVSVNTADASEVQRRIKRGGERIGAVDTYGANTRFTVLQAVFRIRQLNLDVSSGMKSIPSCYFTSSVEDRVALLQGLMDSDGSVSRTGNRLTYHTTCEILAGGVQQLVECLGGIASIREYDRSDEGKPTEYPVRLRLPRWVQPFSVWRKASRYKPGRHAMPCRTVESVEFVRNVESVCIAVDATDRLYVTEHAILTHNTIQAIGVINSDPSIKRVLVIVPASLKLNWRRELKKWLTRPMSVGIVMSKSKAKSKNPWPGHAEIVIINYDLLVKNRAQLEGIEWDLIISDECHYLKNPKAQRSKVVCGYYRGRENGYNGLEAKRWLLLTGTPIVNRPKELYNLLRLLEPGRWRNFKNFAYRYCDAVQTRWGFDCSGASNLEELHQILRSTVMVRRLKSQVLTELPAKQRTVVEIPCNGGAALVKRETKAFNSLQSAQSELRRRLAMAEVTDDRAGFEAAVRELKEGVEAAFEEFSALRKQTAIKKIELLGEHLEDLLDAGHKVVVFAHHHYVIDKCMEVFGDAAVKLDGRMSAEAKQESVDRFQNDDSVRVFVGSITAAGVGITLTASSHVVFVELDWVPGNLQQAEDRCHRIGQTESVNVEYLVLEGSLDAYMANTVVGKMAVIEKALDTTPQGDFLSGDVVGPMEAAKIQKEAEAAVEQWEKRQAEYKRQAKEMGLNPERITAIHKALQIVAGMCDGAQALDGHGFSKIDVAFGHDLASAATLTPKMAVAGFRLVNLYRRQIPVDVLETAGVAAEYVEARRKKESK